MKTRTICDVTLYDLMAEDHEVWVRNDKHFGFILELENESGVAISEEMLHPHAAESLAAFCKQYLHAYERVTKEDVA